MNHERFLECTTKLAGYGAHHNSGEQTAELPRPFSMESSTLANHTPRPSKGSFFAFIVLAFLSYWIPWIDASTLKPPRKGVFTKYLSHSLPPEMNGLEARTFGIWVLLSTVVRCLCAIGIHNRTLYYVTLWTFFLVLGHFISELFVYETAAPTFRILAFLVIASSSILGMLFGLQYLEVEPVFTQKKKI